MLGMSRLELWTRVSNVAFAIVLIAILIMNQGGLILEIVSSLFAAGWLLVLVTHLRTRARGRKPR